MNQIYLVCTRSAICASALTYIINRSPLCYNVVHNNLWLDEAGSKFSNATVIDDWWNIPTAYATTYNHDVRNNEHMKLDTLRSLSVDWEKLNTNKSIALFTHATNTADIIKWRNEHNLPITIITTIMGAGSYKYMDMFLKREYSDEMNKFVSLFDTWQYVYSQFSSMDPTWAKHADVVLAMDDWLDDASATFMSLGIEHDYNIKLWLAEYKMKNGYEEWDLASNNIASKLKSLSYIYGKYQNLFQSNPGKKLFALAILESVRFNNNDITDIQQVIDKTEKIIRNQLTFA